MVGLHDMMGMLSRENLRYFSWIGNPGTLIMAAERIYHHKHLHRTSLR